MTLKVSRVKKYFGGIKALDDCSLEIEKSKITAIIGPNGSGKSTLFNTISNILSLDMGVISFNDKSLSKTKDFEVARLGISRTFQDVRLFKNLTIKDHLEIAMSKRDEDLFTNLLVGEKVSVEKIKAVLDLVGLEKSLSTYAVNLSYGQRKLLDLAVAIAKKHTILMLDEPVAGVNPLLRNKIKEIIKSLNEKGETVLLIEHDMNFVMNLADHIFVMDAGRVIAEGKPDDIQNNKKVLDAYLGE